MRNQKLKYQREVGAQPQTKARCLQELRNFFFQGRRRARVGQDACQDNREEGRQDNRADQADQAACQEDNRVGQEGRQDNRVGQEGRQDNRVGQEGRQDNRVGQEDGRQDNRVDQEACPCQEHPTPGRM